MKHFKVVIVFISALALSACGLKNHSLNRKSPISSSVPTEHSAISGVIGVAGGEVKDPENNISIVIPAGALSSETNITATYIDSPEILSDKLSADFLGAAEFGPDGTIFNAPVQVTINLNKTPKNSELAVFCYSTIEDVWEYVTDASLSGTKATFEVTHFSKYQVVDRTKDFLNEYTNMVRHAQVNGLSDSEIISAFRDYLVNEKHILDQYTTYGGYWYEPCGLKIYGQYQIDGKSGDNEALSYREGDSNKVGNTYGMSIIDGATSNKQAVKSATSNQEVYDITVIVEYKIIKPDIELTASKTKLNKGESATINIRCHYTNVQNFYQEYKDLELANYMLTIAKPTDFTTDKSAVLTDDRGEASFVVTAKENNKAETITVNFDVSGDFGTHAEGNITLGSDGYQITGHTKETLNIVYHAKSPEGSPSSRQNGTIALEIEYDITGSFSIDESAVEGTIEYSNISIKFSASPCLDTYSYTFGGDSFHVEVGYYVFATHAVSTSPSVSFALSGTYNKATNSVSISYGDNSEIAKVEGKTTGYGDLSGDINMDGEGAYDTTAIVKAKEQSVSNHVLGTGVQSYYDNGFLDIFSLDIDYDFVLDPDNLNPTFPDLNNYQGSTDQTILIS